MKWWRRQRTADPETPAAFPAPAESAGSDGMLPMLRLASAAQRDTAGTPGDPLFISREARLNMAVDDAAVAHLRVSEQNSRALLEATQRFRDLRERERAAVRPVYNFGGEGSWPGGEG